MRLVDLFCGRGGWSRAGLALGWDVVGVDVVDHGYPGTLVRWELPVPVSQVRGLFPDLVVASPPCEEFARAWLPWLRGDRSPAASAVELLEWSVGLVGRVGCPVVVECSKFAARHVPGARLFGSYALWGDVPALVPVPRPCKQCRTGADPAARAMVPAELAEWILCFSGARVLTPGLAVG